MLPCLQHDVKTAAKRLYDIAFLSWLCYNWPTLIKALRPVGFGLALAVMPLAACESAPDDSKTTVLGSVDELCNRVDLTSITDTDLEPVKPMGTEYRPRTSAQRFVGRMVVEDGVASLQLSPLPPDVERSVLAAFDPFAACAIAQSDWETKIFLTNGPDKGEYQAVEDRITLGLSANDDPKTRLFDKHGAPRIAMSHEINHGYVDNWMEAMKDGDIKTGQLMNSLHDMYADEVFDSAESFRKELGPVTTLKLQEIKAAADKNEDRDMAVASQRLIDALAVENGLHDFALDKSKTKGPYYVANFFDSMLSYAGAAAGVDIDSEEIAPYITEFRTLQDAHWKYLEKHFAVIDESSAFSDMFKDPRVGHPYNFNEWLASMINVFRFDYMGMTGKINLLPRQREARYGSAIKCLDLLIQHASPELYKTLPFAEASAELDFY